MITKKAISYETVNSELGGEHADCTKLVIDLKCDPYAKAALIGYASACAETNPELSRQMSNLALFGTAEENPNGISADVDCKFWIDNGNYISMQTTRNDKGEILNVAAVTLEFKHIEMMYTNLRSIRNEERRKKLKIDVGANDSISVSGENIGHVKKPENQIDLKKFN